MTRLVASSVRLSGIERLEPLFERPQHRRLGELRAELHPGQCCFLRGAFLWGGRALRMKATKQLRCGSLRHITKVSQALVQSLSYATAGNQRRAFTECARATATSSRESKTALSRQRDAHRFVIPCRFRCRSWVDCAPRRQEDRRLEAAVLRLLVGFGHASERLPIPPRAWI